MEVMDEVRIAPHGSWESPITAAEIVEGSIRLGQIAIDGEALYWSELRPAEQGRTTIMRRGPEGVAEEVLPAPFNARSRVHEYGGGAFCVGADEVWFSNDADQRIHRLIAGETPRPVTPEGSNRYADLVLDPARPRCVAVRESHDVGDEPVNELVAVGFDGSIEVLAAGADFYASPRFSPDGDQFAWIEWNHPNMPWDGTTLQRARVDGAGGLGDVDAVAGGPDVAVFQPEFDPSGNLYFSADLDGWWNLYCCVDDGAPVSVHAVMAEFGLPHWVFGMRCYDFSSPGQIVAAFIVDGISKLAEIDLDNRAMRTIPVPHIDISGLRAQAGRAYYIGASVRAPAAVVSVELDSGQVEVIRPSADLAIEPGTVSVGQPVEFETAEGAKAHGFYYPPVNARHAGPAGELPPLIVMSHGGPTGQTSCSYDLKTQFWTSRGFAILDVNYRGSTGFGRDYRRLLDGGWGVVDVEDCVHGARMLVLQGLVDGDRMAITGGSAGGYTTLCALTFFDVFKAGASHYGIGDLEALARDTHKFESRYLDRLVGAWPAEAKLYRSRSPIHHTDRLSCPVIFFQGLDDKVVPPNQAEAMIAALREKGIPVAYVPFTGEGHGFRRAANIKRALEGELYFYGRVFGFDPADDLAPVEIENMDP